MFRIHFIFCRQLDTVSCTSSSSRERADPGDVVLLRLSGPLTVWVGSLSLLAPVLFLAVREFCPICICLAACIKCCAHSLCTSPSMISSTRGGDSVAYHVTFYFWRTRNTRGGGGGGERDEFWGLRSEFSRPEFTRHPHQTVVFLWFKNDSSADSSPLIQNKYDSRVLKMRYQ